MAITYTNFLTQVRNYTEVSSSVLSDTLLDQFIKNTELDIASKVDYDDLRKFSNSTFTNGNRAVSLPGDLKYLRAVKITDGSNNEIFLEKRSTKLIENKGDTTSPKTTNPPAINKTISINSKSKDLISFQPNFFKDIVVHNIFRARIEPISIVKTGISLMANILKNILLENDFVINALSSNSNFRLKR